MPRNNIITWNNTQSTKIENYKVLCFNDYRSFQSRFLQFSFQATTIMNLVNPALLDKLDDNNIIIVVSQPLDDTVRCLNIYHDKYVLYPMYILKFQPNLLQLGLNGKLLSDLYLVQDNSNCQIDNFINFMNIPKLIIRFSYVGCEMCIDSILTLIKNYEKYISSKDIILWATYQNKRTLDLFLNVSKLTYQTFFMPETDTIINSDRYAMPYIFVMRTKEAKVLGLFFPLKEDSDGSSDYLEVIAKKYFKKKSYE